MCHQTPIVEVRLPNGPAAFYSKVGPDEAEGIVRRHFRPMSRRRRLAQWMDRTLEHFVTGNGGLEKISRHTLDVSKQPVTAFMDRQFRIATEGFGIMDPLDIDEYLAHQGFNALSQVLNQKPEEIIAAVTASGIRGRGGAGFPTGVKWSRVRNAVSKDGVKYVIVNGDEGDPGAFMDRMLMESFPYRVIEGMLIAAHCVGAKEGYIYVRAEYPRAVSRLREAIRVLTERGFLDNFKLHIFEGAGAFVCGEETALIESIE